MARLKSTQIDTAGNTFGTARSLGIFRDSSVIIDEFVGSSDKADFFKIKFARRCYAAISVTGLESNADVDIFSSSKKRVGRLNNAGTRREFSASASSPAGTFYLKVYPKGGGDTQYRLTILTVV
jgi:hypothetical protein